MTQEYLDTLQLYYEEEIEGEAYFAALAARFADPDHKRKLRLLAEIERHAAESVAPLIKQYGISPRSTAELTVSGKADAESAVLDWAALIAEMQQSYPGYVAAFERLEKMGPVEDQGRLSFLTEHEVAAIRFLDLEVSDPESSTAPLEAYLAESAATWRGAAE